MLIPRSMAPTPAITAFWDEAKQMLRWHWHLERSVQKLRQRRCIAGEERTFFKIKVTEHPEQVAIALVLGRALVFSLVNALPNRVFEGLVTQMAMANIKVGQKLNGSMMIKLFGYIAATTVFDLVRVRFWRPPHNLPCPSAFRVVWDGVTLRNGATVCIIMVVFTDSEGLIRSEVVDIPISRSSYGADVAKQIKLSLDKTLHLTTRRTVFRSTSGLPTRGRTKTREGNRCGMLVSLNVDRAYSGYSGNKADLILSRNVGLSSRRPAMADRIHCISGCATKAWYKGRQEPKKNSDATAHCSSAGASVAHCSSAGASVAHCSSAGVSLASSSSSGSTLAAQRAGARRKNVAVSEREQSSSGEEQDDTSSSASSTSSSSSSDQDDPSEDSSEKVVHDHAAQEVHANILPRQFKLELPWCIGPGDERPLVRMPLRRVEYCYFPGKTERWTKSLSSWSRVCSRLHKLFRRGKNKRAWAGS